MDGNRQHSGLAIMQSDSQDHHNVYIELIGEDRWATFGIFNGNAFPPELEDAVSACSTRAAMFLFYVNALKTNISACKSIFVQQLRSNFTESWTQDFINAKVNREMDFIAVYDGLDYLTSFYALLQSFKSLLDIYANLMGQLILPSTRLQFSKGNYRGKKVSGGRIAQWLNNSAPSTFGNALPPSIISHLKK